MRQHSLGLIIVTVLIHHVTSVLGRECQPIKPKDGLNILNCSNADLTKLPSLDVTAEVLDFSKNQFEKLPQLPESTECHPDHCQSIKGTNNHCRYNVSFSRNKIDGIPHGALKELHCLHSLDLSHNKIQSSSLELSTFQGGTYMLQILNLAGNPLGKLPDNVITSPFMPKLRRLDLSHCDLEEIGENSVDDHDGLQYLILRNNKLKTIKHGTFKGLRNLKELDLRYNRIQNIGHQLFGDLLSLDFILLTSNKIESFARHAFYGDLKLNFLDLTMNNLKTIPYECLQELSNLTHLTLSNNPMETFFSPNSSIVLSTVSTLEMNEMMWLKTLDKGALAAFPSLVTLSLQRNKNLKNIHPHFLPRNSSKLREVHLDNNGLSTLPVHALPLKQLTFLSLKGNPWMCDYRIQWMIGAKIIGRDNVKCDLPIQLRGRDINSIDPRKLQRYYPLTAILGLIGAALALPVTSLLVYLVWKRKHHCCHSCSDVHGRYVTVFTRDVDGEGDDQVDIDVRVNQSRLKAVSNGDADDTQPFVMLEQGESTSRGDEDEI